MIEENIQILQNEFNKSYQEYKDYKKYLDKKEPEFKKEREEFQKYTFENQDDLETILDKQVELLWTPTRHKADLHNLQQKLITVFETTKFVLDIPAEIKEEIDKLEKIKYSYFISAGEAKETDPELHKILKKQIREQIKLPNLKPTV